MIDKELLLDLLVEKEIDEDGDIVLKMNECEALEYMVMNFKFRELVNGQH